MKFTEKQKKAIQDAENTILDICLHYKNDCLKCIMNNACCGNLKNSSYPDNFLEDILEIMEENS